MKQIQSINDEGELIKLNRSIERLNNINSYDITLKDGRYSK